MRILSIHADSMWYHATRKMKMAEVTDHTEDRMEECVVLFACIEKLDEKNPDHVIASATKDVLEPLGKLKVRKVMIYPYAHLTSSLGSPQIALSILKGLEESLGKESIKVLRAPFGWYKEFEIRGKGRPLADLSMTICPYEGVECDFACPYCNHPIREADVKHTCAGSPGCSGRSGSG